MLTWFGRGTVKVQVSWRMRSAPLSWGALRRSLGDAYAKGQGVPRDFAQAAAWYRRAADQGNADAQYSLGEMYYAGDGVSEDQVEAAGWFRKAAESGQGDAQFNLAVMFYEGTGVRQDYSESYFWFYVAAESKMMGGNFELADHEKVLLRRDENATYLTESSLSRTQERARKWFEDHPAKEDPYQ
jgi:TPR repeat protein